MRLSGNGGRCNSSYCQCYHSGCEEIFFWGGKGDALPPFCRNLLPTMLEVRYCVTGVLHACAGSALVCRLNVPATLSRKERPQCSRAPPNRDGLAYGRCGCPLSPLWKGALCSRGHFIFNPLLIFTSYRLPTTPGSPSV